MNVDPDTEEMSESERKRAVERAGIPDPADRKDGGDGEQGDGESDADAVLEVS